MTSTGRVDVTSAQAKAIHEAAQKRAAARVAKGEGLPHDEVQCWCCCFQCDFNHSAVLANDQALGEQSVY